MVVDGLPGRAWGRAEDEVDGSLGEPVDAVHRDLEDRKDDRPRDVGREVSSELTGERDWQVRSHGGHYLPGLRCEDRSGGRSLADASCVKSPTGTHIDIVPSTTRAPPLPSSSCTLPTFP